MTREEFNLLLDSLDMTIAAANLTLSEIHYETMNDINQLRDFFNNLSEEEFNKLFEDEYEQLKEMLKEDNSAQQFLSQFAGDLEDNYKDIIDPASYDPTKFDRVNMRFGTVDRYDGYVPHNIGIRRKGYRPDNINKYEPKSPLLRLLTIIKNWLVNIFLKFINFILSIGRRLFGSKANKAIADIEAQLKRQEALLNKFEKDLIAIKLSSKDNNNNNIEQLILDKLNDMNMPRDRQNMSLEKATSWTPVSSRGLDNTNLPVQGLRNMNPTIAEDISNKIEITGNGILLTENKKQYIVIDISNDIFDLNASIEHFFRLFDNAYGSHGEHLYQTGDLEYIYDFLKSSIKNYIKGQLPQEDPFGRLLDGLGLDLKKIDQNLAATKQNTDKLRSAYLNTVAIIERILQTIKSKKIHALTSIGQMSTYDKRTNAQLKRLVNIIKPRIKQGEKLMSQFEKSLVRFQKLGKEIEKERFTLNALGGIVYDDPTRQMFERYFITIQKIIQTIDLRMQSLALYLKIIKDIYSAMAGLHQLTGVK